MCEEKFFRCPVCNSVLAFSFNANTILCCECRDCGLFGYDFREGYKSKVRAYLSLYKNIPLGFWLNKIAKELQETNEILLSSTKSIAESIKVLVKNFQEVKEC